MKYLSFIVASILLSAALCFVAVVYMERELTSRYHNVLASKRILDSQLSESSILDDTYCSMAANTEIILGNTRKFNGKRDGLAINGSICMSTRGQVWATAY